MSYVDIPGVRVGVVLWLIDKDKIFYVPISTVKQMKAKNKKSISYKDSDKWNILDIPSTKKVVFMSSDYSILDNL
uniref:Recombination protein n=1 Tax=Siphoviridae sp. ctiOl67 TaxID=2825622 RepID=A0A8S5QI71_9CAUD|nr:MAG TPA: recombination protein [Siphoviridae sp. ctiOl67]